MILEIKAPSPGESITEIEISSWLVKDGSYVNKGKIIAEIDSDKATLEISAPDSGKIITKAKKGDIVSVGDVIGLIDTDSTLEEAPSTLEEAPDVAPAIQAPSAKKILYEKGIFIDPIKGGKILKKDALKANISLGSFTTKTSRSFKISMLSKLRRKISERLVSVKNNTAILTTFNEVDLSQIFYLRNKFKEKFKERHGVNLGFMSFFTKSCVRALKLYPDVNAMIDGENKISFDYCDISIAISGPKGLVVPVLRNAEFITFKGIEQEIKRLYRRVQEGVISVDEMTGGTFTITNGGVFGSMLSTPIINPPQSAILGMHKIAERPVVINGKVQIRPIMYLALSYDHCLLDGREAVGFLLSIKESIEDPINYLMESNPEKSLELF
ncbi:MAG TPA: dihydrolipoyllysine-residue succinyltransferase [Candidatus Angelobacter sp.]|jgi:2-oxoglutarate dehydrogenase E2 component (dihydrolipoamide succinyltransferase)|nr:dihydrolipoyllysine-residue succinyltransferase [Candidatus Angelobacter sp.]